MDKNSYRDTMQNNLTQQFEISEQDAQLWEDVRDCQSTQELDVLIQDHMQRSSTAEEMRYLMNTKITELISVAALVPYGTSLSYIAQWIMSLPDGMPSVAVLPPLLMLVLIQRLYDSSAKNVARSSYVLPALKNIDTFRVVFTLKVLAILYLKLARNFEAEYRVFHSLRNHTIVAIGDEVNANVQISQRALKLIEQSDNYGRVLYWVLEKKIPLANVDLDMSGESEFRESLTLLKAKVSLMENPEVVAKAEILLECFNVINQLTASQKLPEA